MSIYLSHHPRRCGQHAGQGQCSSQAVPRRGRNSNVPEVPPQLHWSVGYYEKVPPEKELEIPEDHSNKTLSKVSILIAASRNVSSCTSDDYDFPLVGQTLPEMEMRPGDQAPNPAAKDGPPPPPNLLRTPPNPAFLSGILSIYVHQINNLERANLKGTSGRQRESQTGQTTDVGQVEIRLFTVQS
jgi:hypothetical protein